MKDNWNELFDSMKEEDILRNLPDDLPEMEEELAAKRIENKVLKELQIDVKMEKKQRRKRLLAAAVCCIVAVAAVGHKPIMAAFHRLFHDLPGVGVYINDEDKEVYEVQIDDPVQEKDGVRVELKNFYCVDNQIFGQIVITGEDLMTWGKDVEIDPADFSPEMDALEEKFFPTWYYGDIERKMSTGARQNRGEDDGRIVQFTMDCEEFLRLEQGFDTYQIQIAGFDERFTLKIVEPKVANTPEEIGYTVTKNDTSVIARAFVKDEDKIEVEHFVIPSDEVRRANADPFAMTKVAYNFDFENYFYIENADGKRMKGEYESIGNGGKHTLKGTEEDFPLTLHYSPFTGTNGETHRIEVPLTKSGEGLDKNWPKIEFAYGTVEILSATQENMIWEDPNTLSDRTEEATKVTVVYQTIPKEGNRKMYAVNVGLEEEYFEGEHDSEEKDTLLVQQVTYYLPRAEREYMNLILENPSYWIEGVYDIIIEKPMPKE